MFFFLIYAYIVGIDLGTTFSVVAVYRNGEVEVIPDDQNRRTTPSVVSFFQGQRVVGVSAVKLGTIQPENTVFAVKRLIGRRFSDKIVQNEVRKLPYHVVDVADRPFIRIERDDDDDITVSPEEISALVLHKLKLQAERYLGEPVTEAVVTVPAYFNEEQRKATIAAGSIAGLKVNRIVTEPTAAALAYGLNLKQDKYVIVYDLGGGTFDVSILIIDNGFFQTIAIGGDTKLGGEDFDQNSVQFILRKFQEKNNVDPSRDSVAMARLKKACEAAKCEFSEKSNTIIYIPNFFEEIDLNESFTRDEFNSINEAIFNKTIQTVKDVLTDAKLSKSDIDDIVLVGGSTRILKIREMLKDFFDGKELYTSIDPDEAVAYGAAVQASVIDKKSQGIVLVDVYPLTLGLETVGGLMSPIIPRNTRIPVKRTKTFTNHLDDAAGARIEIYEGERPLTRDNRQLGIFELHGLPRAKRKELQIEVTFEIDANAILHVTAQETSTKTSETLEIDTLDFRLSDELVEEAIENSKEFADEDEKDRTRVVARNEYEDNILEMKSLFELEKKNSLYTKSLVKETEDKLKSAETWLETHPMEEPFVYVQKQEELRSELSYLYHRGQLPY